MTRFPDTRISLILRLATKDDVDAWREFAALYAPTVYGIARNRGLQPADAEDVVQELLLAVAGAVGRWQADGGRARFRTWLFRVACNLLVDHFRKSNTQQKLVCGGDESQSLADLAIDRQGDSEVRDIELEYRRAIYRRAADLVSNRVSAKTWSAFVGTAVQHLPVDLVAQSLQIPVGSVYVARSRVMKLLRLEIERMAIANEISSSSSARCGQFQAPTVPSNVSTETRDSGTRT